MFRLVEAISGEESTLVKSSRQSWQADVLMQLSEMLWGFTGLEEKAPRVCFLAS